jgi:hypothetical protein
MDDSTHVAIVIGGVMLLAWCGMGRMVRRDRAPGGRVTGEHAAEQAHVALAGEFRRTPMLVAGGEVACVQCGTPYPAGILFCDCGGETVEEDAEGFEETEPREVSREFLCVHRSDNHWKAYLLRSFLESHAIACTVRRGAQATSLELVPLHRLGSYGLFVHPDDAASAEALLTRVESNQYT